MPGAWLWARDVIYVAGGMLRARIAYTAILRIWTTRCVFYFAMNAHSTVNETTLPRHRE